MAIDPDRLPAFYPAPPYPPAPDPTVSEILTPGPGGPVLLFTDLWFPIRPLDLQRQHLLVALREIAAKRRLIDQRWTYYLGHHSEKVLSEKLRQTFAKLTELQSMFTNYCALVVDSPLARLRVAGWKGDDAAMSQADQLWHENDLDLESEEIHRHAICAGEVFVLAWPRADIFGEPARGEGGRPIYDLALQDARNVHLEYGSRRRRDREWGAKVWLDEQAMCWRAILYYPEEIVRLQSLPNDPPGQCPQDPIDFFPDELDPGGPHSFGAVPLVRFARSWDGRSRLDDVIPVQDRINKLTADKVVAAEFGAFPQRWALTNDDPPDEALRAGPGGIWVIPPASVSTQGGEEAKTQVGQFPSADLGNYDNTIRQELNSFFTLAQLPRHMLVDPGVAPSAQAVLSDEAPFVAHVNGFLRMFGASWRDVMQLLGVDVEPVWDDVEVHNELTAAQTLQALTTAGLPLRMAAEIALDLTEDKLAELDKLAVPPQPGAAVPGQAQQPAPQPDQTNQPAQG